MNYKVKYKKQKIVIIQEVILFILPYSIIYLINYYILHYKKVFFFAKKIIFIISLKNEKQRNFKFVII